MVWPFSTPGDHFSDIWHNHTIQKTDFEVGIETAEGEGEEEGYGDEFWAFLAKRWWTPHVFVQHTNLLAQRMEFPCDVAHLGNRVWYWTVHAKKFNQCGNLVEVSRFFWTLLNVVKCCQTKVEGYPYQPIPLLVSSLQDCRWNAILPGMSFTCLPMHMIWNQWKG